MRYPKLKLGLGTTLNEGSGLYFDKTHLAKFFLFLFMFPSIALPCACVTFVSLPLVFTNTIECLLNVAACPCVLSGDATYSLSRHREHLCLVIKRPCWVFLAGNDMITVIGDQRGHAFIQTQGQ